jgi:hypothetical protein
MSRAEKLVLALRIWARYVAVRYRLRREPLPQLVAHLSRDGRRRRYDAARLARAVDRTLQLGRPTCLLSALVLFRLLREQGDPAELVIGLPDEATDQEAHAWVELDGIDVGPPPGRGHRVPLARFA